MQLICSKLNLRPMEQSDLETKVRWTNDPDVHKFLHYEIPVGLAKTQQWFQRVITDRSRRDFVIETVENVPVGNIGLIGINSTHRIAEFYIAIGEKDYWGKGMGSAATSLLCQWAFNTLDLQKIWANIRAENESMVAMMGKIGFQKEGFFRKEKYIDGRRVDIIHLGLLRDEFKPIH